MTLQLSEQQSRQNAKRNELAVKLEQKQKAKSQVEQDEINVQQRIEDLQKTLDELGTTNPAESAKIQAKIDNYVQKDRMRTSKRMAAEMGMTIPGGNGKKG